MKPETFNGVMRAAVVALLLVAVFFSNFGRMIVIAVAVAVILALAIGFVVWAYTGRWPRWRRRGGQR